MFITFEFLLGTCSPEKIEVVISSPKEAAAFVFFLETTERVRAFKMSPCSPSDLGMAPNNTWVKYRETGFTQEDYYDASPFEQFRKREDAAKLEIAQLKVQRALDALEAPNIIKV